MMRGYTFPAHAADTPQLIHCCSNNKGAAAARGTPKSRDHRFDTTIAKAHFQGRENPSSSLQWHQPRNNTPREANPSKQCVPARQRVDRRYSCGADKPSIYPAHRPLPAATLLANLVDCLTTRPSRHLGQGSRFGSFAQRAVFHQCPVRQRASRPPAAAGSHPIVSYLLRAESRLGAVSWSGQPDIGLPLCSGPMRRQGSVVNWM